MNKGLIRKITLESDNVCYGPMPESTDVTHQRVTINRKGRVDILFYQFSGLLSERKVFYIGKEQADGLIDELVEYFAGDAILIFATDIGTGDLTFTSVDKKIFKFNGSLYCEEEDWLSSYSMKLRKTLNENSLFAFDGCIV